MLRLAISLATGFCVLWHTVVGCCAHHEHAADAHHEHHAAVAHDAEPDDHGAPAEHESDEPCDGADCSFAAAKITTAGELRPAAGDVAVGNAEAAPLSARAVARSLDPTSAVRPPSLRRHLALGVLLI